MRLAVVTNILAPYRVPLFEELARRCALKVFTLAERHANRDWAPAKSDFATLTLPGVQLRGGSLDPVHLNLGAWRALRDFRPDVVLGGGFTPAHLEALAWCRTHRSRYICWGELHLHHESESSGLRRWVRHAAVRASSGWIASSSDSRDAFVHYGASPERVLVSLMPVRNAQFRRHAEESCAGGLAGEIRQRYGTPLILGVGRLGTRKGWPQLLQALRLLRREIRECSLVIAGEGAARAELEALTESLGLDRVFFIGSRELSDIAALYAAADVFAFPTLADTYGAVLAEAVACGTFAVSSIHAGATRDLIANGESGITVDPTDPAALADGLLRALRLSANERAAMAARARDRLPADDIVAGAAEILGYAEALCRPGAWPQVRAAPGS
ncbi:MAG: glycosyltransferase [Pseudomonadota bacterium]